MNRGSFISLIVSSCMVCFTVHGVAQESPSPPNERAIPYFSPENVLLFAEHLMHSGEFLRAAAEFERHLMFNNPATNASILYMTGICYLQAHQPETALSFLAKARDDAPRSTLRDSAKVAYLTARLVANNNDDTFVSAIDSISLSGVDFGLQSKLVELKAMHYLRNQKWTEAAAALQTMSTNNLSIRQKKSVASLEKLAAKGMNLPEKSPGIAVLLSTIFPGSGKVYAGRVADGIYSFLLTASTSWLAYEGFRDKGASSFKGWFWGGFATFFYVGNIYGSSVAVQLHNTRYRENLNNDIEMHLSVLLHF